MTIKSVDFIRTNDWPIRRFVIMVFAFQLTVIGSVALGTLDSKVSFPIVRQLIVIAFLILIPGTVILRILRMHDLRSSTTILYSVALSIATDLGAGLLSNTIYPFLGIAKPFALLPLLVTVVLVVSGLCALAYYFDRDYEPKDVTPRSRSFRLASVLLISLVPLSAISSYWFGQSGNNLLQMLLLIAIFLMIITMGAVRRLPSGLYPIAIFSISFSLLLHTSLISNNLWGWDIQKEYFVANLVIHNGVWNPSIPADANGMLSIVVLAPLFSIISGSDLTWIFKLVYPLIYAMVPVGLYIFYTRFTSDRIAAISVFFFVSVFVFFMEMPFLAKQQIAELLFVFLLLVIFDMNLQKTKKSLLLIISGFSLVVSHYAMCYFFIFVMACYWIVQTCMNQQGKNALEMRVSGRFLALIAVVAIAWYAFIASSTSLNTIALLGKTMSETFMTQFLNPGVVQGVTIVFGGASSSLSLAAKYLQIFAQVMIVIGFVDLFRKRRNSSMNRSAAILTGTCVLIMIAGLTVPYFSNALNTSRLYGIGLLILAPLCARGFISVVRRSSIALLGAGSHLKLKEATIKSFVLFIAVFFLFNSGFVYEIAGPASHVMSLDATLDYPRFNEMEVDAATWVTVAKGPAPVFSDGYRSLLMASLSFEDSNAISGVNTTPPNCYLFLGTYNIDNQGILIYETTNVTRVWKYVELGGFELNRSRIFDNGGSEVFNSRD